MCRVLESLSFVWWKAPQDIPVSWDSIVVLTYFICTATHLASIVTVSFAKSHQQNIITYKTALQPVLRLAEGLDRMVSSVLSVLVVGQAVLWRVQ